ncbi:Glucan 1,3-beta-glucosidase [Termitomyces sp. J132]|nr:Glucan 1,3-beta-glucosidase [Termitomyces sp. J132]
MHFSTVLAISGVFYTAVSSVSGLGTSCSSPLGPGTAAPGDPYWLETINHQGIAAYNSDPTGYQVFRNVKDFGAKGDGVTDDTAAINSAIASGNRCGGGSCPSSTITPALVYFPRGTYLVSSPIIAYYYTQLVGDAKNPPTLLASASFSGMAVIDADPYIPGGGGAQFYTNQNNLYVLNHFHLSSSHSLSVTISFRSVRNFVIDVRNVPATDSQGTGIHWQVAQATSLVNIVFQMSTAADTAHQGIWMENGSGGFMGDLVFNGGKFGMWVGNQQFTVRNITVNNANTGVYSLWNWGWTFQGVHINNCQFGFDLATGGTTQATQTTEAQAIIDATVVDTPIFVRTSQPSNGRLGGSIVLNNIKLTNVPTAVGVVGGAVVLAGGTTTILSWGQGNIYHGTSTASTFTQGSIYAGCKIIFFDAGTYIVTSTLTIPAGTQIVGEAWSVIAGSGSAFQDQANPRAVVRVGDPNSQGVLEISDIIFTTVGPTPGAIVLEWNVQQPSGQNGGAGMWDSHIRLGGAAGTNLEANQCPSSGSGGTTNCFAAFLALHLTPASSAYLEAGPYFQPNPAPPTPFSVNSSFEDPVFTSDLTSAWGLKVVSSSDIIVFGAGLYSFFSASCITPATCQSQILDVDASSSISIYSLSTVATTFQLSVNGVGIVNQNQNINGFASTLTAWSPT